ncbi:hypothetical protein MAPG_04307 [Magnaporthiopsis poae ATCC 64411]|uniref:Uncharacterized protein n=1 Tax=Magnaporthiopsis poae (strain ATCC 64411 / 73-15) TaxID=644358 RepID=A0A0C4DWD1_MAGP6|nr:hypothetical protein MAPG_04307 [Magnaporthiopsis poae ATCC 64411]
MSRPSWEVRQTRPVAASLFNSLRSPRRMERDGGGLVSPPTNVSPMPRTRRADFRDLEVRRSHDPSAEINRLQVRGGITAPKKGPGYTKQTAGQKGKESPGPAWPQGSSSSAKIVLCPCATGMEQKSWISEEAGMFYQSPRLIGPGNACSFS